jgi:hypothetical protein
MERIIVGRWHVCCDREATRRSYEAVDTGSPERCGCCHCRNFVAARGVVYTHEVLDLLDRLGIDECKEAEICEYTRLESGRHLYGGFFHFVGSMEQGADAIRLDGGVDFEPLAEHFAVGFTCQVSLVPPAFAGLPLVQLEFSAQVPWILEDHPDPG